MKRPNTTPKIKLIPSFGIEILYFIVITVVFLSCQGEEPKPSPDSFCIFKRIVYTDPADIGKPSWTFLRCDPDPGYKITDYTKYKGYQTTNCNCSELP